MTTEYYWGERDGAKIWWHPHEGVMIKRGRSYWVSNDIRWNLIGVVPNQELCQPTLGPYLSQKVALVAYEAVRRSKHSKH